MNADDANGPEMRRPVTVLMQPSLKDEIDRRRCGLSRSVWIEQILWAYIRSVEAKRAAAAKAKP